MIIFWAAATIVFIVIEASTVGLASIWFALGSLAALISALLGAKLWLQILWFVVISVATLILTRPLVKKYVNGRKQATNADRLIGEVIRISEQVDNISGTGAATVDGKVWTTRSLDGSILEAGTLAVVKDIQGVKLMVSPKED